MPAGPCGPLAGLPEALPEGTYRLDTVPDGADPTRLALGWALATYAFTRYHAKSRPAASLVWPEGADRGRVERLARAAFSRPRSRQYPRPGTSGPRSSRPRPCASPKPPAPANRVIVGDDLLAEKLSDHPRRRPS